MRRLYLASAILSALLCAAAFAIWIRTYFAMDDIRYFPERPGAGYLQCCTCRGAVVFARMVDDLPLYGRIWGYGWSFESDTPHSFDWTEHEPGYYGDASRRTWQFMGAGCIQSSTPSRTFNGYIVPLWAALGGCGLPAPVPTSRSRPRTLRRVWLRPARHAGPVPGVRGGEDAP